MKVTRETKLVVGDYLIDFSTNMSVIIKSISKDNVEVIDFFDFFDTTSEFTIVEIKQILETDYESKIYSFDDLIGLTIDETIYRAVRLEEFLA